MKQKRLFQIVRLSLVLIVAFIVVEIMVNPIAFLINLVKIQAIREEMPMAKNRWKTSNITDYQIDVQGFVPLKCFYDARITVLDDRLAEVAIRENILDTTSKLIPIEPAAWDSDYGCTYSKMTIMAMFDDVDQSLAVNAWDVSLEVKFDPRYGFVSDYDQKFGYRTGGISDCCVWFRFSNFQLLEE